MEKPKRVLYGGTKTTDKSFCRYVDKLEKYCVHLEQQLKNCNLQNVSQQRELLIAFEADRHKSNWQGEYKDKRIADIDNFLAINCH